MMHGGDGGDIKALRTTEWLTGIYFIIEIGIGLYTGSIAVISDALHTFSAVGGVRARAREQRLCLFEKS